jgi:serine phosphatase RsbU (regulator of sigma subunit)
MKPIKDWNNEELAAELLHFQERAALSLPRKKSFPKLENIDYFAVTEPYKGCVGGDYLSIVNFDEYNIKEKVKAAKESGNEELAKNLKKNYNSFGIIVADISGHMVTDNVLVNYLHGAFKTGIAYELKYRGEITTAMFEHLNTQYYNHIKSDFLASKPFATFVYGEVHNDGRFRFISAGHPAPLVFSSEFNRIVKLDGSCTKASTPLGVIPSKYHIDSENFEPTITKDIYSVNEINLLGRGDILLLYTDGLAEQKNGELNFCDEKLEHVLREAKNESSKNIYKSIIENLHLFSPIEDDLTIAVIKKRQ